MNLTSVVAQIVQARVWAQGLTVGVLIAAGVVSSLNKPDKIEGPVRHLVRRTPAPRRRRALTARPQTPDHSWKDIIAHEQEEEAARKQRIDGYLRR